jgi:hypothetical protein
MVCPSKDEGAADAEEIGQDVVRIKCALSPAASLAAMPLQATTDPFNPSNRSV